ncbi:DUF4406 domain-containing protein [Singulisphaera sp. Ch08]|uniref:DUF4406 domain-containing protein n=1 Tax=Singulisphaera sp. Ch08 TaxID=3120278 RepID=A0AAU7CL84_9BACT
MRIAISGPGRSGKDVAADFLTRYGFRYSGSTSHVITREIARREEITFEAAHEQRHDRRMKWYAVGNDLRKHDPAHLVREVLKTDDLVVGVRDWIEMKTARDEGLVDLVLWIDRDVPRDPTLTYGKELADIVIPNHWGLKEFHKRLDLVATLLLALPKADDWTNRLSVESTDPGATVYLDGQPFGTLPKANFGDWIINGVPVHSMNGDGASEPTARTAWGNFPELPPKPPASPAVALGGIPRDSIALYLSGDDSADAPAFRRIAAVLRHRGWRVIDPTDFGDRDLRRNVNLVIDCDVLVQLPGWDQSQSATLEHTIAERFAKRVVSLAGILDLA